MNVLQKFSAIALLLTSASQGVAQEKSAGTVQVPSSGPAVWNAWLDKAVEALPEGMRSPDLYVQAKGRLSEAQALLAKDPKAEDGPALLRICSLSVVAALSQIRTLEARQKTSGDLAEHVQVLGKLYNTLDAINKLEQGMSSSLRADLEEQKRLAREAREQAEKRFNELNSSVIQVRQDARGTIISMSDILFDVNKATLTENLKTNLAKIAGILTIYKDLNVIVEGHTDNVGSAEYNQKLSEKRAENVMNFLVDPGEIKPERMTSVGYGFTKPVADNDTKEGRQKNRRVDLIVSDKK